MRRPQDRAQLMQHLDEQVGFLRTSAELFDGGAAAEAKRLATALRVLLHHNPPNSHALLAQLDVLGSLRFLDTGGGLHPANPLGDCTLTVMRMTWDETHRPVEGRHVPRLGDWPPDPSPPTRLQVRMLLSGQHWRRPAGRHIPFGDWWSEPVIKDSDGERFSRGDLVKSLANQDGGAHVDPELRESYYRLSRSNSLGWLFSEGFMYTGGPGLDPLGTPVPAAVRQVAYEVIVTLEGQPPGLQPT